MHGPQEKFLVSISERCSDLVRIFSYGTSREGRKLWALELHRAPPDGVVLPGFKVWTSGAAVCAVCLMHDRKHMLVGLMHACLQYVAGLHGDEPSGRQLLLHLAEHLCDIYHSHHLAWHHHGLSAPAAPNPSRHAASLRQMLHRRVLKGGDAESAKSIAGAGSGQAGTASTGSSALDRLDDDTVAALLLMHSVRLVLVPDANPDGFARRRRENA